MSLLSGFRSVSTVPAGSASKAALTGAKTVNGPGPESVSTSPAAWTAATSVVWSFELTAFSTMFFVGIHRSAADRDRIHCEGRSGKAQAADAEDGRQSGRAHDCRNRLRH